MTTLVPSFLDGSSLFLQVTRTITWVGISGTTMKSRKREVVPSSHPGPLAAVASSRKSQTLACFDFLYQNELTM